MPVVLDRSKMNAPKESRKRTARADEPAGVQPWHLIIAFVVLVLVIGILGRVNQLF